jgi:hypothetical protein
LKTEVICSVNGFAGKPDPVVSNHGAERSALGAKDYADLHRSRMLSGIAHSFAKNLVGQELGMFRSIHSGEIESKMRTARPL